MSRSPGPFPEQIRLPLRPLVRKRLRHRSHPGDPEGDGGALGGPAPSSSQCLPRWAPDEPTPPEESGRRPSGCFWKPPHPPFQGEKPGVSQKGSNSDLTATESPLPVVALGKSRARAPPGLLFGCDFAPALSPVGQFVPCFNPADEHKEVLQLHPDQPDDPKVLKIVIIGAPNAGKSTLSNQLLGRKVRRPQLSVS